MILNKKLLLATIPIIGLTACKTGNQQTEPDKPNILFIFLDDLGYGDLSCYNPDSEIPTPNINKLAEQGMLFTDAHAPASVCVPSRYSLLTGRYPFRNERRFSEGLIEDERATIATILKKADYNTSCIGKWHVGIVGEKAPPSDGELSKCPVHHGFDYYYGIPASLDIPPYYFIENNKVVSLPSDTISDNFTVGVTKIQGAFWRGGGITPYFKHIDVLDQLTQKAKQHLGKCLNDKNNNPFFMYFALPAPHTPWLPVNETNGKSQAGMYGDYVVRVDNIVGEILDYLDSMKISDNTLVFFSSDNGPVWYKQDVEKYGHNAVAPLNGMKGDALEGGHRMPFIARWSGKIKAGSKCEQLICFTDVFATFANITQCTDSLYGGEDSYSFLDLLLSKNNNVIRDIMIGRSVNGTYSIRKGDLKLIMGKNSGGFSNWKVEPYVETYPETKEKGQLFNLYEDIGETNNLYASHPEIIKELTADFERIINQGYSDK